MSSERNTNSSLYRIAAALTVTGVGAGVVTANLERPSSDMSDVQYPRGEINNNPDFGKLPGECGENNSGLVMTGVPRRIDGEEPGEGFVEICTTEGKWVKSDNPWEAGETPLGAEGTGLVLVQDIPGSYPETTRSLLDEEGNPVIYTDEYGTKLLRVMTADGYGFVPVEEPVQRLQARKIPPKPGSYR